MFRYRSVAIATLLILLSVGCSSSSPPPGTAAGAAAPAPYVLEDTEVRPIHARSLRRDYQILVSLPASYNKQPERRYPVLFITDANYAFPLVRSIARRVGDHGAGLEDFVLVGVSYADGDTPEYSRRRDYTPSANSGGESVSDMPGRAPQFGQAEAFRRFIADEVFPVVASNYRVDMRRKIYAGHSYGSLLGVHILLTEPTMFERYILGSPSLWFDHKVMFGKERSYASAHQDLPADVFIAIGSFETVKPQSDDPRYNKTNDMVADVREFEHALKSRHYPGLHLQTQVIEDEDHLTVFPAIITRGLQWALPARRDSAK